MGIFDFLNKKNKKKLSANDIILSKLKVGYMVDYNTETFEAVDYNVYRWGEDDFTEEWQLENNETRESFYLEKSIKEGDIFWIMSKKLPISKIDNSIIAQIKETGEPPEIIEFEDEPYHIVDTGAANYLKRGSEDAGKVIVWDFEDESENYALTIEQWSDYRFELFQGEYVEEEDFSNILPSK